MKKRRKAVFTIVKNEKVMLPLWMRYYARHFEAQDIYVLDHQTTDGSTDGLMCNRKLVRSETAFNHPWLNRVVRNFQVELLTRYQYVLFVEADEFVWHPQGVGFYMDNMLARSVRCNGYELQHLPDREADIDLSRPVLAQRSFWWPNQLYCKTLIADHPIRWDLGFHDAENHGKVDPSLYLVHLHRFDYKTAYAKNEERARMKWSQEDVQRGWGYQNRVLGEQFNQFYFDYKNNTLEHIHEHVKKSEAF